MKFSEIANRLTGISTPLVGVSWQPTDLEVSAARRVIAFLEDRRVLYAPKGMEVASHCVHSVRDIRRFLIGELGKLEPGSEFACGPCEPPARRSWSGSGRMAGKRSCTPTNTVTGRAGRFTAPWVKCAGPSAFMWRRSPPSSSWTLRTGWPKSCPPGRIPIRTMTTAILPVPPAGNEQLIARSKARRLRRRVEGDTSAQTGAVRILDEPARLPASSSAVSAI